MLSTQKSLPDGDKQTVVANLPPTPMSDDNPVEPRSAQTEEVAALDVDLCADQLKPSTYSPRISMGKSGQSGAGDAAIVAIRQIQCAKIGPNRPTYCEDENVWFAMIIRHLMM